MQPAIETVVEGDGTNTMFDLDNKGRSVANQRKIVKNPAMAHFRDDMFMVLRYWVRGMYGSESESIIAVGCYETTQMLS